MAGVIATASTDSGRPHGEPHMPVWTSVTGVGSGLGSGLVQTSVRPCTAIPHAELISEQQPSGFRLTLPSTRRDSKAPGRGRNGQWGHVAMGWAYGKTRGRKGTLDREFLANQVQENLIKFSSRRRKLEGAGGINGWKWLCVSWARDRWGQKRVRSGRNWENTTGCKGMER